MKNDRRQKKRRAIASKLTKPKPVELPSGAFRCQVMVNGKRIDVVDDDPEVAHAKALALKSGVIQEQEKSKKSMTVGEAIDKYIESKDSVLSPSTIKGYKNMRKNAFGAIESIPICDIRQETVQRMVNTLAKQSTPKYVANVHGLLSAALSMYKPDMTLRTTLPKKEKAEIAIPSIEEVRFLAEKAKGTGFELPFLLATWMGLRTSEIRGLTWDCVEGDTLHIKQAIVDGENGPVKKTTKSYSGNRRIKIPPYIYALIEAQPHTDDFIVHYSRCALYNHLRRMCDRYGMPHYRFHDLRHVQASVMLRLNVPDKYAMERMGHATTNMLKSVYQHTMSDKSEEVAKEIDAYFSKELHIE